MEKKKKETLERSKYLREIQALPLSNEYDYNGWLNNFRNERDMEIACYILDFFTYFPKNMVDKMLKTSVGRAGFELSSYFKDWKHSDFFDRCYYSFIPGENPNPSDSGNLFIRKLRDELEIPEDRLVNYSDIHQIIEGSFVPLPIIFVDDFVGTGQQCQTAWSKNKGGRENLTLEEIAKKHGHKFVYAPLIVNYKGYDYITKHCNGLKLTPAQIIGEEYNLFNQNCICWKNDINLFNDGVELILRKSKELNIPSTNGLDVNDERGYKGQGLALAFEHGAPDAIPAFFYWKYENWTPLIKKAYS